MKKNYYDASSLESILEMFERDFGMSSEEFAAKVESGETIDGMSGFHRHTWLSFYRDVRRLRGNDFADNASRVLAAC